MNVLSRYTHWLHGRWPAGTIEKLPSVGEDGATNLAGVRVVGDLSGIPLLKFSADTGARAVAAFLEDAGFQAARGQSPEVLDLAIIGGGVAGTSAAIEASKAGLKFRLFEAREAFSTIQDFPKGKPIYTYPKAMTPAGSLRFEAEVKEGLLDELKAQASAHAIEYTPLRITHIERAGDHLLLHPAEGEPIRALRAVVAIGRSGNFRKLGVPGEDADHVYNRLHDPGDFAGQPVLVIGGGDSAMEAAIALTVRGAHVTLAYRKAEFSRPKPENLEKLQQLAENPGAATGVSTPSSERVTTAAHSSQRAGAQAGSLKLMMASTVERIEPERATLRDSAGDEQSVPAQAVFTMIGREAPLGFFRRSGLRINGEWGWQGWLGLIVFFSAVVWMYHWKAWRIPTPFNLLDRIPGVTGPIQTFGQVLLDALHRPDFYYSLLYCVLVIVFGIRRIRRRRTPYVTRQTLTLTLIQVIPLFILPYLLFPTMGAYGLFHGGGFWGWFGETFLSNGPGTEPDQYWRAFGFILAWPLFVYNFFSEAPLWGWLVVGGLQTFVIIPLILWRWGKGAYCGWICSCGALAETMGDAHRHKMPHGAGWNRLNMAGQVILLLCFAILGLRIVGWAIPGDDWAQAGFTYLLYNVPFLNYQYFIDLVIAGIIGYGLYFHFSGRVWCRFFCPLAALMHIYTRFSRFRIFADKKKCISCNVCTSVCHQGIDIMNFANKGLPMEDPECVRCSACVQSCPTGVLAFGHLDAEGQAVLDRLPASPVRLREG